MIYFVVERRYNYAHAAWKLEGSFKKLKEAKAFISWSKESYPHVKHRIIKLKREKIYE